MSEFFKPQSPLNKDGVYFYPLTTEDQVIMDDGSRLSSTLEDIKDKVNNIDFSNLDLEGKSDVGHTHTAAEVGARPSDWTPTAAEVGAQEKHTTKSCTLTLEGWSDLSQTVNVTGVTANNTVIVTPSPSSYAIYGESGVYCSAQADGKLTFMCVNDPTTNLIVNVLILD